MDRVSQTLQLVANLLHENPFRSIYDPLNILEDDPRRTDQLHDSKEFGKKPIRNIGCVARSRVRPGESLAGWTAENDEIAASTNPGAKNSLGYRAYVRDMQCGGWMVAGVCPGRVLIQFDCKLDSDSGH